MASLSKNDKSKAILFRNNSSVIQAIDDCIERKVKYRTFKNPSDLFKMALVILDFRLNGKYPTDKNLNYFHSFKNYEELNEYISESNDSELTSANAMQRRYGKRIYYYLIDAKNKYQEAYSNHTVFCTGHISKGLEWGEVNIYHDFPDINKLMDKNGIVNANDLQFKSDENNEIANDIIQEINLRYVAITRAKHTLNFIKKPESENKITKEIPKNILEKTTKQE